MELPNEELVKWDKTYRLIDTCYPICDIWEDIIASHGNWEVAYEIEALTNPRIRQEIGNISLIPKDRMITGTNSWWVISPFTHPNPNGSRFCDGSYGAYYAADNFITGIKEKAFGLTQDFMSATNEEKLDKKVRVLVGSINKNLHDITDDKKWIDCYNKDDYSKSQILATALRDKESNGIVYKSVRDPKGFCFAAFWPNVVSIPIQERHVELHWNGTKVDSYFVIGQKDGIRTKLE